MSINKQIGLLFKLLRKSYYLNFLTALIVSVIIRGILVYGNIRAIDINIFQVLNGVSLLTTFFLLSLQKNVFSHLDGFTKKIYIYNFENKIFGITRTYKQGEIYINTLYGYIILIVLITATQYIVLLFNIYSRFMIITTIVLLVFGFIQSIVLWNFSEKSK